MPPLRRSSSGQTPAPKRRGSKLGRRLAVLTMGCAVVGTAGYFALTQADSAGGATLSSIPGLAKWLGPAAPTVLTYEAKRGPLIVTVKERGNLESTNNLEAKSEVEGQTTIIMILPEGTKVVKDQLVCELDSAALTDNLANQQIATERAQADYANAIKTREVAEINVEEYKKGIYPQEEKTVMGEIKLAQSELERSKDRLDWSNDMLGLGYISQAQNLSDKYDLQRATFNLEQAEKKLEVLKQYTYEKQIKSLEGDVEKAKADELAKKSTFELEKEKEERLRRMIEKCKIYAPGPGIVVYHQEEGRWGSQEGPSIMEGATVRERQTIFKLPDIDNMQVNTKVHESMIDKVKPGMSSRIRIDAFPNNELSGTLLEVKPLPDPTSFFSSDVKVYTTLVKVENAHEGLRPGMTAEVTILIARMEDVVSVPVQAIIEYGGRHHVWVVRPDGGWENRPVEVGMSNTKYVEIDEGLVEGERVALDPRSIMTEAEKRDAFGAGGDRKSAEDLGSWNDEDAAKAKAASEQPSARAAAGAGGAAGGMREMFSKISAEDRQKLFTGTDDEKKEILKKAGMDDAAAQQALDRMKSMGGAGGPPGGFGGPGGGGPGGGGPGGPGGGRRGGQGGPGGGGAQQ
ncbi:efflux RND transporter periplasmic adaptor subunit [Tautonia plasticadhaerens]|uniref:Macrolide export protein MacA n=1 Tax=Tautonia plasticadhaerens TaxID=2527974 RepID=A0A518H7H6_9BACT|nr:efflux RND transporter periplasmic adaptor subunit [Tautonia plasticadhaerens]QDV36810.1 Macrolide export protein MacA [Tautonia plasticadhaerens]